MAKQRIQCHYACVGSIPRMAARLIRNLASTWVAAYACFSAYVAIYVDHRTREVSFDSIKEMEAAANRLTLFQSEDFWGRWLTQRSTPWLVSLGYRLAALQYNFRCDLPCQLTVMGNRFLEGTTPDEPIDPPDRSSTYTAWPVYKAHLITDDYRERLPMYHAGLYHETDRLWHNATTIKPYIDHASPFVRRPFNQLVDIDIKREMKSGMDLTEGITGFMTYREKLTLERLLFSGFLLFSYPKGR